MKFAYKNAKTGSECRLALEEHQFDRIFYGKDRKDKLLTVAWNRGEDQQVTIDGIDYEFPKNTIVCLMVNQSFHFSATENIVAVPGGCFLLEEGISR